MAKQVIMGAMMQCSFGTTLSSLVSQNSSVMIENMPAANIMDYKPNVNIPTFGMCNTLSNPSVASATSAASGVLTPMPCVPVTSAPWTPGSSTVMINNKPALNSTSTCMCSYGGVISITNPGAVKTNIP